MRMKILQGLEVDCLITTFCIFPEIWWWQELRKDSGCIWGESMTERITTTANSSTQTYKWSTTVPLWLSFFSTLTKEDHLHPCWIQIFPTLKYGPSIFKLCALLERSFYIHIRRRKRYRIQRVQSVKKKEKPRGWGSFCTAFCMHVLIWIDLSPYSYLDSGLGSIPLVSLAVSLSLFLLQVSLQGGTAGS